MDYFNRKLTRKEVLKRVGNMGQIAGAQRMICAEGKGKGTSLIRVRNGGGLDFSVIPDRGMDILDVNYQGIPLAWISKNGLVRPGFFDDKDAGWLRSFGGGMLVTCGLRNVGIAVDTEDEHFGVHGRYTSLPATNVSISEDWEDEEYVVVVSGRINEANTFGENLVVHRKITVKSTCNEILLEDRIINEGFRPEPVLLLYHLNWGSPLLEADSILLLDPEATRVRDNNAPEDSWNEFSEPVNGFKEVVYYHQLKKNADKMFGYELRNEKLGIGINVSWEPDALPYLTQWKMMGEGEYVLGLEPGNCHPGGRVSELEEGRGDILQPLEEKVVSLRIKFQDTLSKANRYRASYQQ